MSIMRINLFKHSDSAEPAAPRKVWGWPRTATMIAGITLASAAALAGGTGQARATASTAAAPVLHFQIMQTSVTANTAPVLAYGAFTGGGTDFQGNTTDTFKFAGGTFRVFHSPGTGPQSFDPHTCLFTQNQHGTFALSHGTGRFAGISGHGTYHISVLGIGTRVNGACSQNTQPVAFHLVIEASGPVHL
jgi:hypothetical protein